jgi:hypothetical protein
LNKIIEHLNKLKQFIENYNENDKIDKIDMVWNTNLDKFITDASLLNDVKFIIIGENPGRSERKNGEYFSELGQAGKILKILLSGYDENYQNKVMFFNKTTIYSNNVRSKKTANNTKIYLEELREKNIELFDSAECICAKTISNIINKLKHTNDIRVIFIGLFGGKFVFNTDVKAFVCNNDPEKKLFTKFSDEFFKNVNDPKIKINIIPHFSGGCFFMHEIMHEFYQDKDVNEKIFNIIFNSTLMLDIPIIESSTKQLIKKP